MAGRRGLQPARLIAIAFTAITLIGTLLLMMPTSSNSGKVTNFFDALFTATSAVTVTGLTTLDTATHWSFSGIVIISLLIQIGGFGIVGFATLLGYLVDGRISLRNQMMATAESSATVQPDVKTLLKNIAKIMIFFEVLLLIIIAVRFVTEYGYSFTDALSHGFFHSISTFNQAGFSLYSDSMMGFARDGWVVAPMAAVAFLASFGFPVLAEIRDRLKLGLLKAFGKKPDFWLPAQWSLNSRIVLWASFVMLFAGALGIALWEWSNPRTLGPLNPLDKIIDSFFMSSMPRSTGFNVIDVGAMHPSTWLGLDVLMFIGGGSASTAGGIKIGTAVVLFYIIYTEIRGEAAVNIGNRRLPRSVQRQALTIVGLSAFVVIGATVLLRVTTEFSLDSIIFEVISATGTVGLSTGITADLPEHAKVLLTLLMLFGRLGPIVVATSLALRKTKRHFEYPKERPLIG